MLIRGKVVDANGKLAAGVELATFWIAQNGTMTAYQGVTSAADGMFTLKTEYYKRPVAVLGLDKERKTGVVSVKTPADAGDVTLKLEPLVRVQGDFFCKELSFKPTWTNVYVITGDEPASCNAPRGRRSSRSRCRRGRTNSTATAPTFRTITRPPASSGLR